MRILGGQYNICINQNKMGLLLRQEILHII